MKTSTFILAMIAAALIVPTAASSQDAVVRETETLVADKAIPNVPGKRLRSFIVDYPPGGVSLSHRHSRSAFIYAYVVSGRVRSQVDDEPVRIYLPGEVWFENPGAHHRVSENASDTEPARLLAVFIVDVTDERATIPDAQ
jgi:quercetin dioxygenase-like cupin family protein